MLIDQWKGLKEWPLEKRLFLGLSVFTLISIWLGVAQYWYFLPILPAFMLVAYWTIVDFRKIFLLLMVCIPLSTELVLPNGFGTDLPTEPLIVGLLFIGILFAAKNLGKLDKSFLLHPISLALLIHLGWIIITTLVSGNFFISLKYMLAKIWFIGVFYFLAGYLIKTPKSYFQVFWCVFWPLLGTVVIIMIRHSAFGFTFKDVNFVLSPFYRNHVAYAGILALFFPLLWFARDEFRRFSFAWWGMLAVAALMLIAIYFSYTRAAYASIIMAAGAYVVIRLRLMRPFLMAAIFVLMGGAAYISTGNRYLEFAPDFNKTISHENFDNLLEATYKMEDISTMERVYRWVAAVQMVPIHPWMGFGPGTFTRFYRPYTVSSFRTYVSDNEEQSGVHCYYLMTLVEQGFFGLAFFLLLSFLVLAKGEIAYHRCTDERGRRVILSATLCTVAMDAFLMINDMVETDKMGSFFFICMAVIVNQDLKNQQEERERRKTVNA
jgi:O-antigen ligase